MLTSALRLRACSGALVTALLGGLVAGTVSGQASHAPLARDGLHDPASPALQVLQEPAQALSGLPPDAVGNRVRWVQALQQGLIAPRAQLLPDTRVTVLDLDILMPRTGEMPMVRFPHRPHTEWLDCSNCHEKLFVAKAGGNPGVNMFQVLQGEYCGLCHGAVSFPLTECKRCHSVVRP